MTAHPGHPSLRARIADALAVYMDATSASEIGRLIGAAPSTVSRRGTDLHAWPAADLLKLTAHDAQLAEAVRVCATGEQIVQGQTTAVIGDLLVEVREGAAITGKIATAIDGGRVSSAEAKELLDMILLRRATEERHLADLRAILTARHAS